MNNFNNKFLKLFNFVLIILFLNYLEFYFIKKVTETSNLIGDEDSSLKENLKLNKIEKLINSLVKGEEKEDKQATTIQNQAQVQTTTAFENMEMDRKAITSTTTSTSTPTQAQSSNSNSNSNFDKRMKKEEEEAKEASPLSTPKETQIEDEVDSKKSEKEKEKEKEKNQTTTSTTSIIKEEGLESNQNEKYNEHEHGHEHENEHENKNQNQNQNQNQQPSQQEKDELTQKIELIKKLIKESDSILIGGGAGLSLAAGLDNEGLKFEENFKDFIEAYGFTDLYSGGFYPFKTIEEKWGYFSRNCVTYIDATATKLYKDLLRLVKEKDYFVLTTNVDDQFEKAGFPSQKIFATQGDFTHLQCSIPCHNKLYESIDLLKEMVSKTVDRKIPTELIPKCPRCGKPMTTHLRVDNAFVMDEYWYQQQAAYEAFLHRNEDKRLLLLEFGVGFNTPSIIRFPFERQTMQHEEWHLVRFNKDYAGLIVRGYPGDTLNDWAMLKTLRYPNHFQDRFIPVSEDLNEVVKRLLE
ncbi:DHS-like NAD/FAD-binding domain-containing protein [Neocallimastix lanati (nom. inval.)]|nr:DHS-like NAD/FAD-binding domain-containing protein [Neocallimastix sp. JGI-2020a]